MLIDVARHAHLILFRVQSLFTIEEPQAGEWKTRPEQRAGRLHFSSCYFSQAFEDRHFTEREGFFRHEVRRSTRSGLMFNNAVSSEGWGEKTRPSGALEKAGVEVKGR
jgi:hypothetical protein